MKLVAPPRFTYENLRDLWHAHEQITGALMALNRSTWAGSIPVIVNLQQVDRVLCSLFNRAEPGFKDKDIARFRSSSGDPQAEAPAGENQNG